MIKEMLDSAQAPKCVPRTILYVAWGEFYVKQAIVSLASIFLIYHKRKPSFRIVVLTDIPCSFDWLLPYLPLEIRLLSPNDVKTMSGSINFILRVKIAAMQIIEEQTRGHVLFIDTDTIIRQNLEKIFRGMECGTCYLHKREWPLRVGRKLHPELCPQDIEFGLSSATQVEITGETIMWNSGVVGIPHGNKQLLADALELCDKYYRILPGWHVEQFSLSILLQRTGRLLGCNSVIFHYWHNKALAQKMITSVEMLLSNHHVMPVASLRKKINAFQAEAIVRYYLQSAKNLLRKNKFLYNAYRIVIRK